MAVTNDWGQGVDNNTIEWGKAADNATNGFGAIYASSAAGDTLLESGGAPPAPSYDADATAYFAAAGITDTTEKDAVNQLVLDLKGTGSTPNGSDIWNDAVAIYPISPTSLNASTYNLRDTTTYNLTWYNSPIHSSTGVAINGANQYADTSVIPSVALTTNDLTVAARITATSLGTSIGAYVNNSTLIRPLPSYGGNFLFDCNTTSVRVSAPNTNLDAFYTAVRRTSTDAEIYVDATSLGTNTNTNTGSNPTVSLFLGASSNNGAPVVLTAGIIKFGIIGNGMTDNQVADLYDAQNRYQSNVISGGR